MRELQRSGGNQAVGKVPLTGIGPVPILGFTVGGSGTGKTRTSDYSFVSTVGAHSAHASAVRLEK